MRKLKSETVSECPCEYALRYVGGAWKILIVAHLVRGKIRRHAELKRSLRGITAKMLTQQLREMEHDGLIERTIYAEIPPKVEYKLTSFGETLLPVLEAMYAWGAKTRIERTKLAHPETREGRTQRRSEEVEPATVPCP